MLKAICEVMEEAYKRGWISTRDGNCSHKDSKRDFFTITPSGKIKHMLRVDDLVRINIDKNKNMVIPEGSNPSGELLMHYLILKNAPKTRVVVHLHPTHIVAAMYAGIQLNRIAKEFPELNRYTKVGLNVPALPPVSKELALSTSTCLGVNENGLIDTDIVGQDRHGVTAWAGDPWTAFEHIERLNHICEIVLLSGNYKRQ